MKTKKSKISKNIVCGIFAVILALSLTGCGGGSGDGDGSGDGGKLTINGLPNGGAFRVNIYNSGTDISTMTGMTTTFIGTSKGSGSGGPVFNLETLTAPYTWTRTGTFPVSLFDNNGATTNGGPMWWASVYFSNGSATVDFSSFTSLTYW